MEGLGRGGFRGGMGGGFGTPGINPMLGLAGLGMFGMMFRSSNRNNFGGNKQSSVMRVASLNGGENWIIESTNIITWNTTGLSGNATIELPRDGGSIWETIVDSTPIT